MRARRWLAACTATVMMFAIGSCSSNGDDDAGSPQEDTVVEFVPETLDRAGYLVAVADVCRDDALGGEVGEPVDAGSTVEAIDSRHDLIETRLDLLQQLPVPSGDEADVEVIVQAHDRLLTALGELSAAVDEQDEQAAVLVSSAVDALQDATNEVVSRYGLTDCEL